MVSSNVNPLPGDPGDFDGGKSAVIPLPRSIPGTNPGTLRAPVGAKPSVMTIYGVGADTFEERQAAGIDDVDGVARAHEFTWINVNGLADVELVAAIGERFGLHPLALEDVLNTHQRPKSEDYGNVIFVVLRMPMLDGRRLRTQQFAMFLGEDFVISFHENPGACLLPVMERLRQSSGRIRRSGPDYVAYSLIDAIVDSYFPGMDGYAQLLDELDDRIVEHTAGRLLSRIHVLRRDLHEIRKTIWKTRDALNFLVRDETPLVDDETRFYLRDCYDHTIQLIDLVESFREMCTDLRDFYMTTVSQRANDVMKTLTLVATIFIPLNFLGSVYGMNFEYMPEREIWWAYPTVLTVMATIAASLTFYFWRRGWLRRDA